MALAHVNKGQNNSVGNSVALAYTPSTSGNLLVVGAFIAQSGQQNQMTISDDKGNIWEAAGPQVANGTFQARIYFCRNCASGLTNITLAALDSGGGIVMELDEFSGHNVTSPLDKHSEATGTGTTLDSGAKTTTTANQIIFGVFYAASGTVTKGASYTLGGSTATIITEYKIVSSAASYSADASLSGSAAWVALMATFSDSSITPTGIEHVNSAAASKVTSSTTVTLNYQPAKAGNMIAIAVMNGLTTGTVTVTDTAGNSITAIDGPTPNSGATLFQAKTFYIASSLSGATTFTATFSSSGFSTILVDEFRGVVAIDQHALAAITSTTAGAFNTPTITTTVAQEAMWICGWAQGNSTPQSPYTIGGIDGLVSRTGYQIVSSIQSSVNGPYIDSAGTGQKDIAGIVTFSALTFTATIATHQQMLV